MKLPALWLGALSIMAALAACSSSSGGAGTGTGADPIEIVSQPEEIGGPIDVDIPLDDTGAFEYDSWPSACDLTDETTLSGIFPTSDEVIQTPRDRDVRVIVIGGTARNETVANAECVSQVGFPAKELSARSGNVVFTVTTSIDAAGDQKYLDLNARKGSGEKVDVGGAECTVDHGRRYDCRTDEVAFNIILDARPYGQYLHSGESTYVVDGEKETYSAEKSGFDEMTQKKVLLPLVEAAVKRLS
jgi:hypothetical protein